MAEKNVKMKRVKVVITEREMLKWPNQVILREFHLVNRLKAKGIPLAGVQLVANVICGKLTTWRETDLNDELEYHYEGVGADRADEDDEL